MTDVPAFELFDVRKTYKRPGGPPVVAVDCAALTVLAGLTAITGPSGGGKSTFLRLVGAQEAPDDDQGAIYAWGEPLPRDEKGRRAHRCREVGVVFQHFDLVSYLSAADNVALPLVLGGLSPREARREAEDFLEKLGMAEVARCLPKRLSGGQQQRVAVARAAIHKPRTILADEPTGSLDPKNAEIFFQLLRGLAGPERAVIIATHDLQIAAQCDRTFHCVAGRLEEAVRGRTLEQQLADAERRGREAAEKELKGKRSAKPNMFEALPPNRVVVHYHEYETLGATNGHVG